MKNLTCLLICLLGGLVSCQIGKSPLPLSQGKEGEVLIVMNDNLWKGPCGDSIRHYLTVPVMGLPSPEAMFTLIQQGELSKFMQRFHNIIYVNVDAGFEKTTLGYKSDVYAQHQLIFNIDAPSADSAIACLNRGKHFITTRFLDKDRDAYITYYQKIIAKPMVEKLREKFQIDVCIPKDYVLNADRDNFVWLAHEEGERLMGVLIWAEAYTVQSQLETDRLIAKMNEVTRQHVPGPSEGSYMADEPTVPPVVKRFTKDDDYCVQMNGLWQTENDFMGGPYVTLSVVDAKRGQIVTGMGFVFYPNREKRQYIRQLEAILHTMVPSPEE